MTAQSVISTVGLTKVFRDFWQRARVWAVRDVDLDIRPGEVFGLLGPNGSGKSTTIKMILGLLHPTRGRISVFGQPAHDVRTKTRIGYLPEESYLYRFLNARETLEYYGTLFQLPRSVRRRRTEELLEMVGLRSAARRPVGEYSKGMARRIGLAQALINDPDLLILDEPTSGLDPVGAKLVKDIIVRIGQVYKKTILLSSHLLADVEEVCDRVAILFGGRVQVTGRMEDVLSRSDMMQMVCERLQPDTVSEIERLVQAREGKTLTISTPRDRLEELFLRIVREAREKRVETGGSLEGGGIAGFLGADQEVRPEAVIESLVAQKPTLKVESVGAPERPSVDTGLISDLTKEKSDTEEAHEEAAPAGPRPGDIDRDLLSDLTGDGKDRKDA
ncbi:MAG: ABC transporter ATP-binding protein [Phycisphaerae bacterium]|nr:ABC transporter ATP-binding protein [Phycisphaerae bacterium]